METITAKEASEILGVSKARISKLSQTGIIDRIVIGKNRFALDKDTVLKYKATRKPGRPIGSYKI